MPERIQRLRLTFAREDVAKYLTHLDVMRMWERVLKRAALPVAYSEGFTPRPRIALAAPMAVGLTSECELLEAITTERLSLAAVQERVDPQLPRGFRLLDVREVPLGHPSLQSMLRAAGYDVSVPDPRSAREWCDAIARLLASDQYPWQHMRGDELREYDLRPLVLAIELLDADGTTATLRLRLRNDDRGSGRPEQIALALGAQTAPTRIHRIVLELEEPEVARAAYRAAGRPGD